MKVKVTIEGVSPLLMNRFTDKNEIVGSGGHSPVHGGDRGTPREQAMPKRYADADTGELFIPGTNIYSSIIGAGIFHKIGKNKVTTTKTSLVPAGLWVLDLVCPLGTTEFEVDSRSVVNPSTGGRFVIHRPRLDKWRLSYFLEIDASLFTPNLARLLVDHAGSRIGLGDFRPQKKGAFGRSVVVGWEVLDDGIRALAA